MIKFFVANGRYMVHVGCHGDEFDMCLKCNFKFVCYTGEMHGVRASEAGKCDSCGKHCALVYQTTECGLFGTTKGLIESLHEEAVVINENFGEE